MNKLFIIGNLTRDPDVSETPSGIKYAKFGVAVTRNYANANGERETDFFDITVWRERADLCEKYLRKGNKVAISGSMQFRTYEDDEGRKRKVAEVNVAEIEFLTPRTSDDEVKPQKSSPRPLSKRPTLTQMVYDDDDIPF